MKIPNPWPWHPLSRCTVRPGDHIHIMSTREPELEVSEGDEVLIEPVKYGDNKDNQVVPVGQGRIWSKKWGLLDLEDHAKKMQLVEEEAKLEKRKVAQRKREKSEEKRHKAAKPDNGVSEKLDMRTKAEPKLDKSEPKLNKTLDLGDKLEL